jgi:serine protease Do
MKVMGFKPMRNLKSFKTYILLTWLLPALVLSTAGNSQVMSTEQNYSSSAPGVVMVQTMFSATVYVNKVEMNQRRFNQLVDSVKRMDTTGTMFTAEEKLDIVVKALYNNPFRFLSATTEYYRQQHRILSSGTGFFITGDGYIVTNCHIIDRDSAFIRRKFIQTTYQEVTDANIQSLQSSWEMTLTDEQRNLLNNAYSAIYSQVSSMIIFDLKRDIFVQFRVDNAKDKFTTRRIPARVVIKGRPMPGKDVAILKVDSVQEMPTLLVTRDSIPRIGEQVLVYGYPEPVTSNAFLAKETNIDPTLTSGVVSALKRSVRGWPVIQMDAVITHGSSGSPVSNSRGEIIGLATFGSLEQNTTNLASGFNFAIPMSVVKGFLDSLKITPQMSKASTIYNSALDLFYTGYYNKALKKFETVVKLNASYPELYFLMQECSRKIASGQDQEAFTKKSVFRIIAMVVILVGLALAFKRWRTYRTARV